jgi:hypothetical protein
VGIGVNAGDLMTARTAVVVSIRPGAPRVGRLRPVVIAAVFALLCVPGVAAGATGGSAKAGTFNLFVIDSGGTSPASAGDNYTYK